MSIALSLGLFKTFRMINHSFQLIKLGLLWIPASSTNPDFEKLQILSCKK